MERQGIPLHDAERYFDQDKWAELLRAVGDRAAALALVTRHSFGEHFDLNPLAAKIRREFVDRLVNGSLVATGCLTTSVEGGRIPGPLCRGLQPDFVNDRLKGREQTFLDVRVLDAAEIEASTQSANLLERWIEWMRQRSLQGESRRGVLVRESMKVFGQDFTTRMFATVYKAVFEKRRGRPSNKPPSSK